MKSKLYDLLVKTVKEYNENSRQANSYFAAIQAEELYNVTSFEICKDRMKLYCEYATEIAKILGVKLSCKLEAQRLYDVDWQYTTINIEEEDHHE